MNGFLGRLVGMIAALNPGSTPEEIADLSLAAVLRGRARARGRGKSKSLRTYLRVQRRQRRNVISKASRRAAMRARRGMQPCGMGSKG